MIYIQHEWNIHPLPAITHSSIFEHMYSALRIFAYFQPSFRTLQNCTLATAGTKFLAANTTYSECRQCLSRYARCCPLSQRHSVV